MRTGDLTGCSVRTGDCSYSGNREFHLSIGGPSVCLKEEEWDICEEGLDNNGSDCLLFQREVEDIQETEMKRENEDEKKRNGRDRIIYFILLTLSLLFILFVIWFTKQFNED